MATAQHNNRTKTKTRREFRPPALIHLSRTRPPPQYRHKLEKALEEEAAMVAQYAMRLALLGMTPLIVFLLTYYFMPDLLQYVDPTGE